MVNKDGLKRRWQLALWATVTCLIFALSGLPLISQLGWMLLTALLLGLLLALLFVLLKRLLWSVGRTLAFSYLLIGVLPIPMVLAIAAVGAYLLSGLFLGHLFRNALSDLYRETAAVGHAAGMSYSDPQRRIEVAWYRNGERVTGSTLAPQTYPEWLDEETRFILSPETRAQPSLVALADGRLALAAAFKKSEGLAQVAIFSADLETELRSRTAAWVEPARSDDSRLEPALTLEIFDETYFLVPPLLEASERRAFLQEANLDADALQIVGFERCGAVYSLEDGSITVPSVSANLFGQPITIYRNLFSSASKIDSLAWLAFVIPAFLLLDVYILAVLMAIFLIFSLSRAVNRLSAGTEAVIRGDFTARIPVRRSDQIGALHTSFNQMAGNIENLVEQAAQKEVLDKELEIAHEMQMSLIPNTALEVPGAEFSTSFEPSLAIGGDYFDIVRLREDQQRLAVIIADVAGHGLPAGLRMVMLKAAVQILVREAREPERILEALDEIVRSGPSRAFVTATLSLIDLRTGTVDITNAGHTPIYRLRRGDVDEILLPSTPLGALGNDFATIRIELEPGDFLVWLSDGLVEAANENGEAFGFDRTRSVLTQRAGAASSHQVRQSLIDAVHEHTQGRPVEDDQTLVVMRFVEEDADAAQEP